jgi:subtilase family serine protease
VNAMPSSATIHRLAVLVAGVAALLAPAAASASGAVPARPTTAGVTIARGATDKAHWACAQGLCDAIIDPRPSTQAGLQSVVFNKKKPEGGGEEGGIDPEELRAAYAIPATGGVGQTIAVVEGFSYKQAEKDLAKFRSQYGIAPCTAAKGCLTITNSHGAAPANHGFTEWEPEDALDLDMASAACPECHIMLVSAEEESWKSLGAAVNYAAGHSATEISNSYGLAEGTCTGECAEAEADWSHPGIFVSVSSGDEGYDNEFVFEDSPSFPAALPTVAAIGGTSLRKSKTKSTKKRAWIEKVWGERSLGLGTGSGCSSTWVKPAWQKDPSCAGRMTNDVAAVGACETPVSVYDSTEGGWIDLCGTSVSSPLVAGIEAHASPNSRSLPGGEAFYTVGTLFDVNGGSNGRCSVKYFCHGLAGYDGPTGGGTPDGPLP